MRRLAGLPFRLPALALPLLVAVGLSTTGPGVPTTLVVTPGQAASQAQAR